MKIKPPSMKQNPARRIEVPATTVPDKPGGLDGPPVPSTPAHPPKGKGRADFRDEEFRKAIAQHGKYVIWRKALLCPCHAATTQQADINCPRCDGSGWYYVDPQAIQVHMAQADRETKLFEKFGMWLEGTTAVTSFPEHRLGNRDSIEMRDSIMTFTELLTKGNRRGIRSKLPVRCDSARYRIANVVRMIAQLDDTVILFESPKHFVINAHGWIEWTPEGDALVPTGSTLSIRYEFHPVWIVISHPHALREVTSGRKMPEGVDKIVSLPTNAAAKLDFLLDHNTPNDVVMPVTGSIDRWAQNE